MSSIRILIFFLWQDQTLEKKKQFRTKLISKQEQLVSHLLYCIFIRNKIFSVTVCDIDIFRYTFSIKHIWGKKAKMKLTEYSYSVKLHSDLSHASFFFFLQGSYSFFVCFHWSSFVSASVLLSFWRSLRPFSFLSLDIGWFLHSFSVPSLHLTRFLLSCFVCLLSQSTDL